MYKRQHLLRSASIPVAGGATCTEENDLKEVIEEIGYPIVLKPVDGNHGKGASINVKTWEEALEGFQFAQKYSYKVIVEKFVEGFDFRVLVINNKVVAAAQRIPANITGDGKKTIQQLIDETNKDPRRCV